MVKLQNNVREFMDKFKDACIQARFKVANQILNDSNLYVREDTGELKRSSVRGSNLPEGVIGWDTPYALRVYYTGTPSTDRNPNASLMWVEVARNRHGEDWLTMLAKELTRLVND